MKPRDVVDLIVLGAIWGGAFPMLRLASPVFGPLALIAVRVCVAGAALCFIVRDFRSLQQHAGKLFVLGLMNTAIPFTLFSYATLSISAGLASLLNATTPMFGAAIAWAWLGERLSAARVAGVAIGFLGIGFIVWDKLFTQTRAATLGVLAGLAASALYGCAACFSRRYVSGIDPRVNAAGSVLGAAIVMIPIGSAFWPSAPIAPAVWAAAIALGLVCTALAYVIYFRLMPRIGAARTVTVTFLIPVFGILWGALLLGEPVTARLLLGCAIVLIGTGLATGLLGSRLRSAM